MKEHESRSSTKAETSEEFTVTNALGVLTQHTTINFFNAVKVGDTATMEAIWSSLSREAQIELLKTECKEVTQCEFNAYRWADHKRQFKSILWLLEKQKEIDPKDKAFNCLYYDNFFKAANLDSAKTFLQVTKDVGADQTEMMSYYFREACESGRLELVKLTFFEAAKLLTPKDFRERISSSAVFTSPYDPYREVYYKHIAEFLWDQAPQYGLDVQKMFFWPHKNKDIHHHFDHGTGIYLSIDNNHLSNAKWILERASNESRLKLFTQDDAALLLCLIKKYNSAVIKEFLAYIRDEEVAKIREHINEEISVYNDYEDSECDAVPIIRDLSDGQMRALILQLKMYLTRYNIDPAFRQDIEYMRGNIVAPDDIRDRDALKTKGITEQYKHMLTIARCLISHPPAATAEDNIATLEGCKKYVTKHLGNNLDKYSDEARERAITYVAECLQAGKLQSTAAAVGIILRNAQPQVNHREGLATLDRETLSHIGGFLPPNTAKAMKHIISRAKSSICTMDENIISLIQSFLPLDTTSFRKKKQPLLSSSSSSSSSSSLAQYTLPSSPAWQEDFEMEVATEASLTEQVREHKERERPSKRKADDQIEKDRHNLKTAKDETHTKGPSSSSSSAKPWTKVVGNKRHLRPEVGSKNPKGKAHSAPLER